MSKPLTREQQRENRAFLKHLRRTGNALVAAKVLGFGRGRFYERRKNHPAFAAQWDAALAIAHADLTTAREGTVVPPPGEPYIRLSRTGRWQVRRAQAGLIDHAARQRFLAALSATANVALAAAAAGNGACAFYNHRKRNPAFAREWQLALEMGYERLELALLESAAPESFSDDDWRRNDPPAIPQMTANQALQLMYLHQKEARLGRQHVLLRRLSPGETSNARSKRLGLMYEQEQELSRMRFRIAEAERLARGEPTHFEWDPGELPDLSQVQAAMHAANTVRRETWRARPADGVADPSDDAGFIPASGPVHHADRALFGGWRIEDIPERKRRG